MNNKASTLQIINIPNTMQVAIGLRGGVIIDDNVYAFHINTTTKDIGGHEDTLFEVFERLVTVNAEMKLVPVDHLICADIPLFLVQSRVDANTGEVAVVEELVQFVRPGHRLDKDNDLGKEMDERKPGIERA